MALRPSDGEIDRILRICDGLCRRSAIFKERGKGDEEGKEIKLLQRTMLNRNGNASANLSDK